MVLVIDSCSVYVVNIGISAQVNRCHVTGSLTTSSGKMLSYECNQVVDPVQGPVKVVFLVVLCRVVRSGE